MPSEAPREIFLNPGDHAFSDARTILGPCVSVNFWHPALRIGNMCHYLLPTRAPSVTEPPGGAFQVKMFAGGSMFPALSLGESLNWRRASRPWP